MANLPPQMMNQRNQMPQGNAADFPTVDQMQPGMEEEVMEPESKPILAHFDPEEISNMDRMYQDTIGELQIDPETGLRDYTALQQVMTTPQFQDLMADYAQSVEKPGFSEGGYATEAPINEPGRPSDPQLEELREMGTGNETELAIITSTMADIMAEMNGGQIDYNPETGFPEFGFWKNFIRIAAPIAGAIFGGPIGGALGGFIGGKATGQTTGAALKSGLIGGAIPFAAGALGGVPVGHGIIGGGAPIFGNAGIAALGGLGGTMGGGLGSVGTMFSGAGVPAGAAAGTSGAAGAAGAGGVGAGGILGGLSKYIVPAAVVGASLLGQRQDQRNQQQREAENRAEANKFNASLTDSFKIKRPGIKIPNPERQSHQDYLSGKYHKAYINPEKGYAQGGPIRGRGTGQSDSIPKNVQKNSYIIDASTVSDIGDGSTDAGFNSLNNYFSKFKRDIPPHASEGGSIEAMVANGEYEVPAEVVTSLGRGSNEKGAKVLEQLVKRVREQKRTSGDRLPPKAHALGGYIKQMNAR